jgi:hypothetical protein
MGRSTKGQWLGASKITQDEKNYVLSYATIFGNKVLESGNLTKNTKSFPQTDIIVINLPVFADH